MKKALLFIGGMAVGVAISWQYHKNKYEQMIQEDMESLRARRGKTVESAECDKDTKVDDKSVDEEVYEPIDEDLDKASNIIDVHKYKTKVDGNEETHIEAVRPYIINSTEFASVPMYDTDTFYYHKNDVITNDDDSAVIEDVEYYLGMSILEVKAHFGESEEDTDAVYVRNDKLKTDIEILWDEEDFK